MGLCSLGHWTYGYVLPKTRPMINSSNLRSRTRGPVSVRSLRDGWQERRSARAAYRCLEADLATYTTQAEINDLLALLSGHDSVEAEQVRSILTSNLAHASRPAA